MRPARLTFSAVFATAAVATAQTDLRVAFDGVEGAAVLNALARECYEAGLAPEPVSDSIMDCSAVIEERSLGAVFGDVQEDVQRIVVRHKLRFLTTGRAGEERINAETWTETAELGTVIEQPVTTEEYLRRVRAVLTAVVARLTSRTPPPWVGRYESEQAWHLAAHVRAVSHCDTNLASFTAESLAAQLATAGIRPLYDDVRDRCEQLYTYVFEWGLARGSAEPSVAEYARYRASLPAEQRICYGQLALDATCSLRP